MPCAVWQFSYRTSEYVGIAETGEMLKIWFPTIRTGSGSDVYTERLVSGLIAAGIDAEISWFPLQCEYMPWRLRNAAMPPGTTHIHANSWSGWMFSHSSVPLIVTVHHWVHDPAYHHFRSLSQGLYHRLLIRRFERASLAAASAVTAVSQYTASCLRDEGVDQKLHVIHNGVDSDFFRPLANRADNDRFVLLFVGNNSRRKGFDLLAPIMEKLGEGYELWCTGGLRTGSGGSSGAIRFLGCLDDQALLRAYQQADALLFPTRYEGFGLAACEAMSCGLPVVTSATSALPELAIEEETGFLNQVDDVKGFCTSVRRLAEDRVLAVQMGKKGQRRVLTLFSQERMIEQYIKLYQELA